MRQDVAALTLLSSLALSFPDPAQACACCSEIGQRLEQTGSIDTYEGGEIAQLRFAAMARLFTDPGFPDSVEGVRDPSDQDYRLAAVRVGKDLIFDFTDAQGNTGRIVFPLPKRFTRFEVDPREAVPAGGTGPSLYKEWRFQGISKLSGILAAGGVWAHARLILHGRGNSCTSASDFENWTLSATGKRIRFKFLGAMVR